MAKFDVIVIGAGPAGEVCAGDLADGGMNVAIAERELVAGECSYWACMPTKAFVRAGEVLSEARHAPGAAQAVTGELDPGEVFNWRDVAASNRDDTGHTKWLTDKGIEVLRGHAKLAGVGAVEVNGSRYEGERIVIATGSDPMIPPIDGLGELDGLWTNREATETTDLPKRLLVLGGGPVGAELGQGFARLGVSVALVEGEDRILPREPPSVAEVVADSFEQDGIELRVGEKVTSAGRRGDRVHLDFEKGEGLEGDAILVATGRKPRLDGLGLDSVGIEPGKQGIDVDERLRAADGVWAIGDATGVAPFTHVGKYQARVAAADILGNDAHADYRAVPRVTFTDPQVASVGESEGEKTATVQLAATARSSTYARTSGHAAPDDELAGFITLVSDGEKLTGAVAVGPEAGEWLQQATLAIRAEVPLDVLRDTIQPFPTFSEAFLFALLEL